ncbi:MAG: hypothetical protein AAF621_03905 [Pseudomonadota bacterium]
MLKKLKILFITLIGSFILTSTGYADKKDFDQYLFSLSWSPTYCMLNAQKRDADQCDTPKKPYYMIVHGLWPQSKNKNILKNDMINCKTKQKHVPAQVVRQIFPIMPSYFLISHSWIKHGSCSGLSVEDYFHATRQLYQRFKVKDFFKTEEKYHSMHYRDIVRHINSISPELYEENIIVKCEGRMLREIRICMKDNFDLRVCHPKERRTRCRVKGKIFIPYDL